MAVGIEDTISHMSGIVFIAFIVLISMILVSFSKPTIKKYIRRFYGYIFMPLFGSIMIVNLILNNARGERIVLLLDSGVLFYIAFWLIVIRIYRIKVFPKLSKFLSKIFFGRKRLALVVTSMVLLAAVINGAIPDEGGVAFNGHITDMKLMPHDWEITGLIARGYGSIYYIDPNFNLIREVYISDLKQIFVTSDNVIYTTGNIIGALDEYGNKIWEKEIHTIRERSYYSDEYGHVIAALSPGNTLSVLSAENGDLIEVYNLTELGVEGVAFDFEFYPDRLLVLSHNETNSILYSINETETDRIVLPESVFGLYKFGDRIILLQLDRLTYPEMFDIRALLVNPFNISQITIKLLGEEINLGIDPEFKVRVFPEKFIFIFSYGMLLLDHDGNVAKFFVDYPLKDVLVYEDKIVAIGLNLVAVYWDNFNYGEIIQLAPILESGLLIGDVLITCGDVIFVLDMINYEIISMPKIEESIQRIKRNTILSVLVFYILYMSLFMKDLTEKDKEEIVEELEKIIIPR